MLRNDIAKGELTETHKSIMSVVSDKLELLPMNYNAVEKEIFINEIHHFSWQS